MTEDAIIVGASGALGLEITRRLAARGLRVIAVGRNVGALDELVARVPGVVACVADIASDDAIPVVAAAISNPVRILVHAPGVPVAGGVLTAPTAALAEAVNIKVGGFLRIIRAADPHLVKSSRLVAIGGHYGTEPSAYAAAPGVANAALANLIRQLSWAYGPRGITAHLVAPGPADTERMRNVAVARAAQSGSTVDAMLEELRMDSAIRAFTTPEQVGWAVALLADPEADALAGSALMLDSGRRHGLP